MRIFGVTLLAASLLAGCVELGVVGDSTSISIGRSNHGHLVDGTRIPDQGEGFFAPAEWRQRGNRWGTDELVDLLTGVGRRLAPGARTRLAIADLSVSGGGPAHQWHRSHQSGRDVDLIYYQRDSAGTPVEPTVMHVFDPSGVARDGSGATIDFPRTWQLVKELVMAPEAPVQWIFMYEPFAQKVIEYAQSIHEPELLVAVARRTLKQPKDSARHDDHMHIRVYCSPSDLAGGCADVGPYELLLARDAELGLLRAQGELGLAFVRQWWRAALPSAVVAVAPMSRIGSMASTRISPPAIGGGANFGVASSLEPTATDATPSGPDAVISPLGQVCIADVVPPDLTTLARLLRSRPARFAMRFL